MQIKNNDNHLALEQDKAVRGADKASHVVESNKTHDAKKQAEQQADRGQDWQKFAQNAHHVSPSNINDVAAAKQVEAGKESARIDIEAKLRENTIKA